MTREEELKRLIEFGANLLLKPPTELVEVLNHFVLKLQAELDKLENKDAE